MSERGRRIKEKLRRRAEAAKRFEAEMDCNGKPSVFDSSLALPETVIILGSGANAVQGIEAIKQEHFVIATNKSALLCPKAPDLFMCHARAPVKLEYWKRIMAIDCPRAFGMTTIKKLQDIGKRERYEWHFVHDPGWNYEPSKGSFLQGVLRSGATISGAALQLCYWKGVKRVYLCGVDMFGEEYYDGTKADSPGKRGKTWADCVTMDRMITACRANGMAVFTLSDSKTCAERTDRIG